MRGNRSTRERRWRPRPVLRSDRNAREDGRRRLGQCADTPRSRRRPAPWRQAPPAPRPPRDVGSQRGRACTDGRRHWSHEHRTHRRADTLGADSRADRACCRPAQTRTGKRKSSFGVEPDVHRRPPACRHVRSTSPSASASASITRASPARAIRDGSGACTRSSDWTMPMTWASHVSSTASRRPAERRTRALRRSRVRCVRVARAESRVWRVAQASARCCWATAWTCPCSQRTSSRGGSGRAYR